MHAPWTLAAATLALLLGTVAPPGRAEEPEEPTTPVATLGRFLARKDWLSRALAAKELSGRSEDGVVASLATALATEEDPRVVALLLRGLRGRPHGDLLCEAPPEAIDRLVPLARDDNPVVSTDALEVLSRVPPSPLPGLPEYVSWWARNRRTRRTAGAAERARRDAARSLPARGPDETVTVPSADDSRFDLLDRVSRRGLEVVICLDSTGSMAEEIAQAKATVKAMTARLRALAPRFRVGLVTYDDDARLLLALSPDEGALAAEIDGVYAIGGGDTEEGVDRAVLLAIRQDRSGWSAGASRSIVVVGDAPPHEEDVPRLLGALRRARADEAYESPLRVDTLSASGGEADRDGYVPHFREIARAGGGSAVRLSAGRSLADEIVASSFGPAWRERVHELLRDLAALEAAAPAKR
jgi:Mg-chelatase subunit ChlD